MGSGFKVQYRGAYFRRFPSGKGKDQPGLIPNPAWLPPISLYKCHLPLRFCPLGVGVYVIRFWY